jgi:hypothetical protein
MKFRKVLVLAGILSSCIIFCGLESVTAETKGNAPSVQHDNSKTGAHHRDRNRRKKDANSQTQRSKQHRGKHGNPGNSPEGK